MIIFLILFSNFYYFFFFFSNPFLSEDVTGAWQSVNGSEENIFQAANLETLLDELDKILDCDSSDKESLYYKMIAKENEVSFLFFFPLLFVKKNSFFNIVSCDVIC